MIGHPAFMESNLDTACGRQNLDQFKPSACVAMESNEYTTDFTDGSVAVHGADMIENVYKCRQYCLLCDLDCSDI